MLKAFVAVGISAERRGYR